MSKTSWEFRLYKNAEAYETCIHSMFSIIEGGYSNKKTCIKDAKERTALYISVTPNATPVIKIQDYENDRIYIYQSIMKKGKLIFKHIDI